MCLPLMTTEKDQEPDPLPDVIPRKKNKPLKQIKGSPLGILPDVAKPIEPKPLHITPSVHNHIYSQMSSPVLIQTRSTK